VYFYANEHQPVHVHGFCQGRESRAEIVMVNGLVTEIHFGPVAGMRPLEGRALADFRTLVSHKADEIVQKWVDFFVHGRQITPERITQRLP
jgi:hypothetical protein